MERTQHKAKVMSDLNRDTGTPLPTAEALRDIHSLCEYAYEQGYHEMGYDPVKIIEKALENAREFVAANWRYPNNEGLATALADLGLTSEAALKAAKATP
jgi:hypothetical protein